MDSEAYSALARQVTEALKDVKHEWFVGQLARQGRLAAARAGGAIRSAGAPAPARRRPAPQWASGRPVTAEDRRAAAEVYNRARSSWLRRQYGEAADDRYPAALSDPQGPYTRMLLGGGR